MGRSPEKLTPQEFELLVKGWLEATGYSLKSFEARHLEPVRGDDGEYTIDVTVRFTAFDGAQFLVLAECKRHRHPIKRSVVEVLQSRLQSTGAQKGFIFATSSFQSGAIEYAEVHGIALVQVVRGEFAYIQMSADRGRVRLPDEYPEFVGICTDASLGPLPLLVSQEDAYWLGELLKDGMDREQGA